MTEKNTWKPSKNKHAYKPIKNALRFGRLFFPFQQGDDEVPVVSFWAGLVCEMTFAYSKNKHLQVFRGQGSQFPWMFEKANVTDHSLHSTTIWDPIFLGRNPSCASRSFMKPLNKLAGNSRPFSMSKPWGYESNLINHAVIYMRLNGQPRCLYSNSYSCNPKLPTSFSMDGWWLLVK